MFALILDSLGGTELLFILVVALIFFGPRKLPQLARSMGKGLAEFRKASDDFKRTWEREVEMESARVSDNRMLNHDSGTEYIDTSAATNTTSETETESEKEPALYTPADSEAVVSRGAYAAPESTPETTPEAAPIEPTRKQDWL